MGVPYPAFVHNAIEAMRDRGTGGIGEENRTKISDYMCSLLLDFLSDGPLPVTNIMKRLSVRWVIEKSTSTRVNLL